MDGYRKKPVRFECVFTRIVLIGDVPVTAAPDQSANRPFEVAVHFSGNPCQLRRDPRRMRTRTQR
jgi:hypothetical protein